MFSALSNSMVSVDQSKRLNSNTNTPTSRLADGVQYPQNWYNPRSKCHCFGRETTTYIGTLWWKGHCFITTMNPIFMPNNRRNDPSLQKISHRKSAQAPLGTHLSNMKLQATSGLILLWCLLPTLLVANEPPVLTDKARAPDLSPQISDFGSLVKTSEMPQIPLQVVVRCSLESFTIGAFCSKYFSYTTQNTTQRNN